jgi:glycosyltransferase involved in cell wall biosynthesis
MPAPEDDTRPGLAIITNTVTPYHVNLERLIAEGIPEFKVHVLITHWASEFQWEVPIPPQLHLERFGAKGESPLENPLRRPVWGWRKGGRMMRYFRENNIRVAMINGYRFISYLRLMNYCDQSGIPFFVNQDSNIRGEPKLGAVQRTVKRGLYKWWLKRASGVFSMGSFGDEFFLKYGADVNRIYRVPYWPDYDAFTSPDHVGLERFRKKYGLNRQRRYLIYSGRLVQIKRVDLLIDAFADIANQRPDWDLLIVGDGVLREELQRRVPAELRSRIVWTGFLEGDELGLSYHAADALVLPSDREPWALVVQEAMAAGRTVIASDVVGAARELVVDGVSGRIFPKGDRAALAAALAEATRSDRIEQYQREAKEGLQRYREELDPVAEVRRAFVDTGILK